MSFREILDEVADKCHKEHNDEMVKFRAFVEDINGNHVRFLCRPCIKVYQEKCIDYTRNNIPYKARGNEDVSKGSGG